MNIRLFFFLLKKIKLNFIKAVAVFTAGCFCWSSVFAQSAYAVMTKTEVCPKNIIDNLNAFVLPSSIGKITNAYYSGSNAVVINIQDLHCHVEVQKNIGKILALLDKRFGLKDVYVEGAVGQVDASWLNRVIKNKAARDKIVGTLFNNGILSGAEYYAITAQKPLLLKGLEKGAPYFENLQRLGNILEKRHQIRMQISELRTEIETIARHYFTHDNLKFQKLTYDRQNEKIDSAKYYSLLLRYGEKAGINVCKYENIISSLRISQLQKMINYRKVSRQLQGLIASLKETLPFNRYSRLMKKTADIANYESLYIDLSNLAKEKQFHLNSRYKELNAFFTLIEENQRINPVDIIDEERKLVMEIYWRNSKSLAERDAAFLWQFYRYFESYLFSTATSDEYTYLRGNMNGFRMKLFRYAGTVKAMEKLEPYIDLFDDYYQVNIKRNEYFVNNLSGVTGRYPEKGMPELTREEHIKRAVYSLEKTRNVIVVVNGGFHTSGFTSLLKKQGVSYITIIPNITVETKESEAVYFRIVREQSKLFSSQALKSFLVLQEYIIKDNFNKEEVLENALEKLRKLRYILNKKQIKNINKTISEKTMPLFLKDGINDCIRERKSYSDAVEEACKHIMRINKDLGVEVAFHCDPECSDDTKLLCVMKIDTAGELTIPVTIDYDKDNHQVQSVVWGNASSEENDKQAESLPVKPRIKSFNSIVKLPLLVRFAVLSLIALTAGPSPFMSNVWSKNIVKKSINIPCLNKYKEIRYYINSYINSIVEKNTGITDVIVNTDIDLRKLPLNDLKEYFNAMKRALQLTGNLPLYIVKNDTHLKITLLLETIFNEVQPMSDEQIIKVIKLVFDKFSDSIKYIEECGLIKQITRFFIIDYYTISLLIGKPFNKPFKDSLAQVLNDLAAAAPAEAFDVADPEKSHITVGAIRKNPDHFLNKEEFEEVGKKFFRYIR
jgi:hypothetical protein